MKPHVLGELEKGSFIVILSINYAEDVWKQLAAYEIADIYNLRNLEERLTPYRYDIPWHFTDRSKGKNICAIYLLVMNLNCGKIPLGEWKLFRMMIWTTAWFCQESMTACWSK